ncbi:MAG: polysaccharide biosynthesis/export family protein [Thermodesulfobacteriota bacterium]|nr:polysaccharide biosynthesis/export family protein [Thermodesulfobacteriota bacterium]
MTLLVMVLFSSGCSLFHKNKAPVKPIKETQQVPAQNTAYLIGPDDILLISVWKDPDLTREVIVRPDDYISFPLVGDVKAGGLTVAELKNLLTQKVSEYIPEVNLTVMVTQFNKVKIYVIGKVNRPGEFRPGKNLNVMQALTLAGGLTPFADRNDIIILRTNGNNQQTQIPFNYKKVKKGKDLTQNIMLQTGDVVVVP